MDATETKEETKVKVAEIELTPQEVGNAVAERISHTRLTPAHCWNSYTLEIRILGGEFAGAVVRYFLEPEEDCPACAEGKE